jgi:hypothetical protein
VWGAGSKGATFLNLLQASDTVECVIDVNPRKHGMFIAGTGHRIEPPEVMANLGHVSILLMNPLYENEVRTLLGDLGVRAHLEIV